MIFRLFRRREMRPDALYGAIVMQARRPAFYRRFGVGDTVDGRFEMVVLHAVLVFRRLRRQGEASEAPMQALLDLFFADMEHSLREMGTSDLAVPRRMRDMASAFYGRLDAYVGALDDRSQAALAAALGRNVFAGAAVSPQAAALAAYVFSAAAGLEGQAAADLLEGRVVFGDPADFITGDPA